MTFEMRHIDWFALLVVTLVCALIVVGLSVWTALVAPLRFFINLNASLVGGAALFCFSPDTSATIALPFRSSCCAPRS